MQTENNLDEARLHLGKRLEEEISKLAAAEARIAELQAQLQEAVASIVSSRFPKSQLLSPFGCRALACGSLHPVAQRGGYVVVIFVKCVTPTANNSPFFRYLSPSPLF